MVLVSPWRRPDFIQRYGLYVHAADSWLYSSYHALLGHLYTCFYFNLTKRLKKCPCHREITVDCHLNFNILHFTDVDVG